MMAERDNLAVAAGGVGQVRAVKPPMPITPAGGLTQDAVLVRMLCAPINPADLLAIDGRYAFPLGDDMILGAEGVGIVQAAGDAASDVHPGMLVMLLSRGNWCRYRQVPRSHLIILDDRVDPQQAAMMRINPLTAHLLLEAAGAASGDVIVQNAATSSVAAWVRMIAAQRGVAVIDIVRQAGSDLLHAVTDGADLAEQVKAAAQGRPVRAALDCIAGEASGRLAACLADGGQLIVFGHLSGSPLTVPSTLLTGRGLSIRGFSLRPAEAALGDAGRNALIADLLDMYRSMGMTIPVRATLPLSQAEEAIALSRTAGRGRVLLDLSA